METPKKNSPMFEPASKFQPYAFCPLVSDPKGVERIERRGEWWGGGGELFTKPKIKKSPSPPPPPPPTPQSGHS
jgi:hypothetical protein